MTSVGESAASNDDPASTGLIMACISGSVVLGISLIVFEILR